MWSCNDLDGVSLYRHWGPMLALEKLDKVKLISGPKTNDMYHWPYFRKVDMVFAHRPFRLDDFLFFKECKKYNLPIWVDMDDDIFNVPTNNPVHDTFASREAKERLAACMLMADRITVATEFFKIHLELMFKGQKLAPIEVIPNALFDDLLPFRKIEPHPELKNSISWRGSPSHLCDLLYYQEEIVRNMKIHEKRKFLFWGYNPFFITDQCQNSTYVRPLTFNDYIIEFCKSRSKLIYVPLYPCHFNYVKSNIAWLEGTLGGAVVLGPATPEWDRPGCLNYSHELRDFDRQLNNAIQMGTEKCKDLNEISMKFIIDNLLLSQINEKRMKLIEGI